MNTTLHLLRHARTGWNRAGRIQGRTDEPLDAESRAELAGLALPPGLRRAAIVSSPLARAVETAAILRGKAPRIEPELIEMDWGAWEGRRGADLVADPDSGYRHIEDWGWDFRPPGGESPRDVSLRLEGWLACLRGSVVAVTHIGVMRVILAHATGWDFCGTPPFRIKRNRLYRVDIGRDGGLRFDSEPTRLLKAGK